MPHLLTHRVRAVVFEDHTDLHRRIDDESVAIDENSVLVPKQGGPRGAPGMAEWAPRPTRRGSSSTCFRLNEGVDFAQSVEPGKKAPDAGLKLTVSA